MLVEDDAFTSERARDRDSSACRHQDDVAWTNVALVSNNTGIYSQVL